MGSSGWLVFGGFGWDYFSSFRGVFRYLVGSLGFVFIAVVEF